MPTGTLQMKVGPYRAAIWGDGISGYDYEIKDRNECPVSFGFYEYCGIPVTEMAKILANELRFDLHIEEAPVYL